jgi:hypothetical protein
LSAANLHQISLTHAFATLTFIRAVSRKDKMERWEWVSPQESHKGNYEGTSG